MWFLRDPPQGFLKKWYATKQDKKEQKRTCSYLKIRQLVKKQKNELRLVGLNQ